jgi:hypothetical protein
MPDSKFTDMQLTCVDRGESFIWTASEQEFFNKKNFTQPKRCPKCRAARKNATFDGRG